MNPEPGAGPDSTDPALFLERYLVRFTHRGRTVRILIALLLTTVGLVPVPYISWGFGLVLFGPAAVLLAIVAMERPSRRIALFCSIPTAVGMVLALFSVLDYAGRNSGMLFGAAVVTSVVTALLGGRRAR